MASKRSAEREVHRELLDVAFWLRQDQLLGSASRAGTEAPDAEQDVFAPAERVGAILHAVAAALREIPFGDVRGIDIRRITDLTVDTHASLNAPIAARARAVGSRELTAGRRLVVINCDLTNRANESLATFSVETETTVKVPSEPTGAGSRDSNAVTERDLQSVDNIPV